MPDNLTSLDEFLNTHKDVTKGGNVVLKAAPGAPRTWDKDSRSCVFTMSAEVEDRDRDIIYQDGIETDAFLKNPQAFFNHASYNRPVGSWSDLTKIMGRPKRLEGKFTAAPKGINEVADNLALDIDAGLIRTCSIGFIPKAVRKREKPEEKKDDYYWPGYEIIECELVECSPCTIPSNPAALAKALEEGREGAKHAKLVIEEILDTYALPAVKAAVSPEQYAQIVEVMTGTKSVIYVPKAAPPSESERRQEIIRQEEQRRAEMTDLEAKGLLAKLHDYFFGPDTVAKRAAEQTEQERIDAEIEQIAKDNSATLEATMLEAEREKRLKAAEERLNAVLPKLEQRGIEETAVAP